MDPVYAGDLMVPPYDGSIANLLKRPFEEFPDKLALTHADEERTYRDFGDRVRQFAGGLHAAGFDAGDRIGICVPNGIAFCEVIWGCIHAGVIASPLNPAYRRREIDYQLGHADAEAVITTPQKLEHAEPVAEEHGIDVFLTQPAGDRRTIGGLIETGEPTTVERTDDDILLQPYTSGTTGRPKGVLLTHRNFRVQLVRGIEGYTTGEIRGDGLIVLPMYHITGMLRMLSSTATGRTMHLLRPDEWDPVRVLETIDAYDVPSFSGVTTMYVDLLETYEENPEAYDLSSLESASQGGAKLPEPMHEELEERFDIEMREGYGHTETTAGTHTISASTFGDKVGSVGQPIPHTASKIVDEDGEEVPVGEEGKIWVQGPQVMKGYYKNDEATDAAFSERGYFKTGDIAYRDEDNYYYVIGRETDMILTGGYNVYPSEVERVLYDHPAIAEAAVFGVPDDRRGETVAAAVSPAEGHDLDAERVKEYVLDEIAPYKHPRVVDVRDELPKTGSGKIRKIELRDQFLKDGT
ncbi:MAG: class I adenylate-forming enzyme family protein [Halobacteriales archaeon]